MSEAKPAALPAGRVGRAHGLDGSFYVTGPVPRLLVLGASVNVDGRDAEIVRRSGTDRHPIVRLQGIADRSSVEAMRGATLTVAQAQAPQLGEGEWWAHELAGCVVRDGARRLGVVEQMLELPSCEVLEVQPDQGGAPLLVPMVRDAIRKIDTTAQVIEVNAGFLDLPEPPANR